MASAQEASHRQIEMDGLELSVGVLLFSAQQEPHAGQFLKIVNVFKEIIQAQGLSEPEQPQNASIDWTNTALRPLASYMSSSGSSSEAASSRRWANSDLIISTPSSTFDLGAYPNTESLSNPSFSDVQYLPPQHFNLQLAQTGIQSETYPTPLDWSPSSTFVMDPALDLRINHCPKPTNSTAHYQLYLQDFHQFDDTASRNQA